MAALAALLAATGTKSHAQDSAKCAAAKKFITCFQLQDSITLFQNAQYPIVRLTSTTVMPNGQLVVADAAEAHLKVFGPTGNLLQVIGRKGEGPGEFSEPRLVSMSPTGQMHVLDTRLLRITVFDHNLRLFTTVPLRVALGHITGMVVDSAGRYRLVGLSLDGIAVAVADAGGNQVDTLFTGGRGTRGMNQMWRVVQAAAIAGMGRKLYLVSSTRDTLYTIDMVTRRIEADVIPVAELTSTPPPPAVFDREGFARWANSFFRPTQVYEEGGEVVVTMVRGNFLDGGSTIIATRRAGTWKVVRDGPLVLHVGARQGILALLNPDLDRVVLGRYRPRP